MRKAVWLGLALSVIIAATAIGLGASQASRDRELVLSTLDRYERTATTGSLTFESVSALTSALNASLPGWLEAAPAPDKERRRRVAALLVLDLAIADYQGGSGFSLHRGEMIEWGCQLLRRGEASEFERVWMLASWAVLQPSGAAFGDGNPLVDAHLRHARDRFPTDGRLRLAEVLTRPAAWGLSNRPGAKESTLIRSPLARVALRTRELQSWPINPTVEALTALLPDSSVAAEARAHLGLIQFHRNKLDDSVKELESAANSSADPFVRNLAWLIAGLAYDAQKKPLDAVKAYEHAVRAIPTAKASATALAALWFVAGSREQASVLLDGALSVEPPTLDPWQHIADMLRFVPAWMAELHAAVGHRSAVITSAAPIRFVGSAAASPPSSDPSARYAPWTVTNPELPTFRATSVVVLVDVSVRTGNRHVEALGPGDFEVLDNGVRQSVQSVATEPLPIDLTMVVDYHDAGASEAVSVSGSASYMDEQRARLATDVPNIAALLENRDRIRLILVENEPREVLPLQPAGVKLPPAPGADRRHGRISYGRNSAVYDAVGAALMRLTPMGRRHLVLAFTEGADDASVLSKERLLEVAGRADAVMHVSKRATSSLGYPKLLWPPQPEVVATVARLTGGTQINSLGGSKYEDIRRLIERLRQSYLIRYEPSGVAAPGWHQIQVRVLKPGKYDVEARKGYWGG